MGAVATNYKEQIEKLKGRGMCFDNWEEDKIKDVLLDIGYYRLGFYCCPFFVDEEHNLASGTKFSDIVALYYLDVDLRNILMRYISRIEINFRTKLIYYVSNKYKASPFWFVDSNVVSNVFIRELDKYYNCDFIDRNKPIKAHHEKYYKIKDREGLHKIGFCNRYEEGKYAPAWKTLEFFSFGTILKIYRNLIDNEIKERISRLYEVKDVVKFVNFMETIVLIRNTCAHSGVLFDFKTPKGISAIPAITFENRDRHSLASCIKVISYMLGQISSNRRDEMNSAIRDTLCKYKENQVVTKIIQNKMKIII